MCLFLAAVLLMPAPAPAGAQVPGGRAGSAMGHREAFRAQTLQEVGTVTWEWTDAWDRDDAEALSRAYTDDAVLMPLQGAPALTGREAIREHFEANLPSAGTIALSVGDFWASGELAYVLGTFEIRSGSASEGAALTRGTHVTIFLRQRRGWQIRSQLFRPASGSGVGDATGHD